MPRVDHIGYAASTSQLVSCAQVASTVASDGASSVATSIFIDSPLTQCATLPAAWPRTKTRALAALIAKTVMAIYATIGTRNAACKPEASATRPATCGRIAPPIIAMHSSPDVPAAEAELRSRVSVKIVGNMIELHNPIARAQAAAAVPDPWLTHKHRIAAINAAADNSNVARIRVNSTLPANRPIIAPSELTAETCPALSSVTSSISG